MNVWYVSYGSNLLESRFLCYINGGRPIGSHTSEIGCRDKTRPKSSERVELSYPLYFSKNQSKWGKGGVAFIGHHITANDITIGRKYLITAEQFSEVVAQENNQPSLDIDLHEIISKGYKQLNEGWYGRVIYVGDKDGYPIFTFTSNQTMDVGFTKPSAAYLSTIANGLLELGMSKESIIHYFITKKGIENYFSKESLNRYIF